jgi:predicted metal-dependent phosphoesterase TrpH
VIDLHTHSFVSDGSEAPGRISELAAEAGCSALALTDHDNLAGLREAQAAAQRLGIRLVPGCEVSCAKPAPPPGSGPVGGSVHMLVYFVEDTDGPLQRELAELRNDRFARNHKLVDRLRELGIGIDYDMLVEENGGEEGIGRPHFARVLVRLGAAEDITDAFDRWLADGRPAYVPKARITPAEAARLASESGGVAVLAHPLSLALEPPHLERLVSELAEQGLQGMEAFYGRYSDEDRAQLQAIAGRAGLVATGGSDFHGTFKPDLRVGIGTGDLHVPDEVLDALVARRPGALTP